MYLNYFGFSKSIYNDSFINTPQSKSKLGEEIKEKIKNLKNDKINSFQYNKINYNSDLIKKQRNPKTHINANININNNNYLKINRKFFDKFIRTKKHFKNIFTKSKKKLNYEKDKIEKKKSYESFSLKVNNSNKNQSNYNKSNELNSNDNKNENLLIKDFSSEDDNKISFKNKNKIKKNTKYEYNNKSFIERNSDDKSNSTIFLENINFNKFTKNEIVYIKELKEKRENNSDFNLKYLKINEVFNFNKNNICKKNYSLIENSHQISNQKIDKYILIIDDEYLIRNTIKRYFSRINTQENEINYITSEASNVFEAINIIYNFYNEKKFFEIVIIDELMPLIKGSHIINLFKTIASEKNFYDMLFISYSAFNTPEIKEQLKSKGADFIINKPISFEEFNKLINNIVMKK